jgi:hypothetical protein
MALFTPEVSRLTSSFVKVVTLGSNMKVGRFRTKRREEKSRVLHTMLI